MFNIIFYFYNYISTLYENLFFKNNYGYKKNNLYSKNGYQFIKIKKKIKFNFKNKKKVLVNKYMKKYILNPVDIDHVIIKLFYENNLKEFLEKNLKFKFDINFIIAYQTFPVQKKDKKKGWFANHWHKDKTFSKNIVKLIIPLESIKKNSGGTQIFNKITSQKNIEDIKKEKPIIFTGSTNDVLLINPNLCYHKAGNPKFKSRSQIMIQLNPSKNWSIDNNLYEKQFKLEPKFPLITNLLNKKNKLKWKHSLL